jgi:hypothetical protein
MEGVAMSEIAKVYLSIPVSLKDAAKSLTQIYFDEPSDKGEGLLRGVSLPTISDALVYLMLNGIDHVLANVDAKIDLVRAEHRLWQLLNDFFLEHPALQFVSRTDFDAASPVQALLSSMEGEALSDADIDEQPMTREQVMFELITSQRVLSQLVTAKGAIQRARVGAR